MRAANAGASPLPSGVRTGLIIVVLVAVVVFAACAAVFDSGTLAFVGAAMVMVMFFAGAAVVLGAISRARSSAPPGAPEDAEIIRDEEPRA